MIPKAFALWLCKKREKNLSLIFSPSFLHCGEPAASFHLYLCSLHRTASMLSRIRAGPLASPGIIFVLFFVFCQQHTVNTISNMFGDPSGCERWNCCLQEVLISKDLFLSFDSSTGKDATAFYTERSRVTTRPTPALWCIIKDVGTRQQIFRYELISITQIQRTSTNTLVARDTRAGVDTSVSVPCQTACNTLV